MSTAQAYHHEGQQGTNAYHFAHDVDGHEARKQGDKGAEQ